MIKVFVTSLTIACLCSCSTYRSGSTAGYRGVGPYATGSDYVTSDSSRNNDDSITDEEQRGTRGRLGKNSEYIPSEPFYLSWPVSHIRINRGFAPRNDRHHAGLDLGGVKGTPILAAHEGVVIYAGRDFRGYGNMIMVEYDKEWATLYAHLSEFYVKENTIVRTGDVIGSMGRTGRATGVHLHFEVMHNQLPIDPMYLLSPTRVTGPSSVVDDGRTFGGDR